MGVKANGRGGVSGVSAPVGDLSEQDYAERSHLNAVCLALTVARPEYSVLDAAEETRFLQLSAENECEKGQPAWQRNCRSTIRHDPR
jgi:hypothetical protein